MAKFDKDDPSKPLIKKQAPRVEIKSIEDLLPDPNNANKHTQRGHGIVENSIRRRGVGRGILAAGKNAKHPIIMAGNLTHEKARDAGIQEVVLVHTTGNQLVVNVRDDLDPASAEAIALAIEDNAAQDFNPDIDLIAQLAAADGGLLAELRKEDAIFGGMLEEVLENNGIMGEEKLKEKNEEIRPRNQLHILISIDLSGDIKKILEIREKINQVENLGAEVIYGANG